MSESVRRLADWESPDSSQPAQYSAIPEFERPTLELVPPMVESAQLGPSAYNLRLRRNLANYSIVEHPDTRDWRHRDDSKGRELIARLMGNVPL